MFIEPSDFAFTSVLEENWRTIQNELIAVAPKEWIAWPERFLYDSGWSVYGFHFFGRRNPEHCAACPETARLLGTIPGLVTAGFSAMAPCTHIRPHRGYTGKVLRCHLGLIVPPHCALRVGGETRPWNEGKCMVFDDTVEHEAWNQSANARTILLLDFLKEKAGGR